MSFKTRAAFYFLMSGMHYMTFVIGTDLKTLGFINLPTTEENITNESNMHFKKKPLCYVNSACPKSADWHQLSANGVNAAILKIRAKVVCSVPTSV